ANFTIDISNGRSRYHGVNAGVRRRLEKNVQLSAWYSLSSARGTSGGGGDELSGNNIQNHLDPFSDIQFGPSGRTDARHRISLSAVLQVPGGVQIAPIFRYRSSLPVTLTEGVDLNQNGVNNDIPTEAFAFNGLDANHNPIVKSLGSCTTINCGRGTPFSQLNLRVSKGFRIAGTARIEAIGEVFNLFNALNPGGSSSAGATGFSGRRVPGTLANKPADADLMR